MTHKKVRVRFGWVLIVMVLLLTAGVPWVSAGDDGAWEPEAEGASKAASVYGGEDPDDYGIAGINKLFISAEDFMWTNPDCAYQPQNHNFWSCWGTTGTYIYAPIRLPPGSLVTGMRVFYYDNSVADLTIQIDRFWYEVISGGFGTSILQTWSSAGTPEHTSTYVDVPDFTVQYHTGVPFVSSFYHSYRITAWIDVTLISFRGVVVYWNRQISPAPGVATFPDVDPGYWAFQEIEALAASEITTGFPDGTFRPTAPVTRAQMATFLARALGLHWPD